FLLSNRQRPEDRAIVPGWHYVDNRLRILDTVGITALDRGPRIHLREEERKKVAEQLRVRLAGRAYWILHAFAADLYKTWPLEKAGALLERSKKVYPDKAVLLTGGGADRAALQRLADGLDDTHVVAGEFDIAATAGCLLAAACVVAPDTGVLHLAAALGVPVIGLYAATSALQVGPRSRGAAPVIIQKSCDCEPSPAKQCPYVPPNCMDLLGLEEVGEALDAVLTR